MLSATVPEAAGEVFHLADGSVTWTRWFESFGAMCGRKPRRIPIFLARAMATVAEAVPSLGLPLTRAYLDLYQRPIVFDTTRAERVLGWKPLVGYDEGQRRAEAWLRETGRL